MTSRALANSIPPKVLPFVIPKNLLVGERISITCTAASGSKPLTFMWLKNDSALRGGSAVHIADSSDYSMLHIDNLKNDHAGNYTCVVSNAGGTVSYSDTLHVKGHSLREDNARVRQWDNGTLLIARTTKEDAGRYICQAGNTFGDMLEEEVLLTEESEQNLLHK
ncbi:cell adhesion molecule, putative [Ixodes scapularis]|uniref:Cell adhesion molecule, putative n=1 Tax=Ixodes scapularis TaxID=6945 RepID=B7P780_IXOSC|nr:cell adhesion molecule, putative [Ixodes scapularis]|eukprot:XP_002409789.1 cell adhesion molecule, putative [Ixodes scapularis]